MYRTSPSKEGEWEQAFLVIRAALIDHTCEASFFDCCWYLIAKTYPGGGVDLGRGF